MTWVAIDEMAFEASRQLGVGEAAPDRAVIDAPPVPPSELGDSPHCQRGVDALLAALQSQQEGPLADAQQGSRRADFTADFARIDDVERTRGAARAVLSIAISDAGLAMTEYYPAHRRAGFLALCGGRDLGHGAAQEVVWSRADFGQRQSELVGSGLVVRSSHRVEWPSRLSMTA